MRVSRKMLKAGLKDGAYCAAALLIVLTGFGCASAHRTTKTVTTVTYTNAAASGEEAAGRGGVIEKRETTTTTTSGTGGGHPGLISSTVHAVGWVIALPFRLVGGLISWIF